MDTGIRHNEISMRTCRTATVEPATVACWEYMKCGCEPGGINVARHGVCPAYPNYGRQCAHVAGTHCNGATQGCFASKLHEYYRSEHYDRSNVGMECFRMTMPVHREDADYGSQV
jgi:hypothetical protein